MKRVQKLFIVLFLLPVFQGLAQQTVLATKQSKSVQIPAGNIKPENVFKYSDAEFRDRVESIFHELVRSQGITWLSRNCGILFYIDEDLGRFDFFVDKKAEGIKIRNFTWHEEAIDKKTYQIFWGLDLCRANPHAIQAWEFNLPKDITPEQIQTYYRFWNKSEMLLENLKK